MSRVTADQFIRAIAVDTKINKLREKSGWCGAHTGVASNFVIFFFARHTAIARQLKIKFSIPGLLQYTRNDVSRPVVDSDTRAAKPASGKTCPHLG